MIINNKRWQRTDLGDKIVMVGQMGAAVHTAVTAVAGVQVGLECLGLCQLYHVCKQGSRMVFVVVQGLLMQVYRLQLLRPTS